MTRTTLVFGPAYLDRVLNVDRPLVDPATAPPLDQSVDGHWKFGTGLRLEDPAGGVMEVELPDRWPGPFGVIGLSRALVQGVGPWRRFVRGTRWHDDLGGMGSGFAAAFGGELVSALGGDDDPTSRQIAERLARASIAHRPIIVPGHAADWTLLITSGEFGDKLPVGFRGCHAALATLEPHVNRPCDLRVVASFPNPLAAEALRAPGASIRMFAPAMRNMLDRDSPLSRFAGSVDILCCNRREWDCLGDRDEVARRVSILSITDGANGSFLGFKNGLGEDTSLSVPAFPRSHPPQDTNRAGECYAATLVAALLDMGWTPGPTDSGLARRALERASAAAGLEIDRRDFGFPTAGEIDRALRRGRVDRPDDGASEPSR
jgi:ribokinase